jgi:hypothetical protein
MYASVETRQLFQLKVLYTFKIYTNYKYFPNKLL